MIFIDVVNHPTELIYIFALVGHVVSGNVHTFVSWLRRHGKAAVSIINIFDKESGKKILK